MAPRKTKTITTMKAAKTAADPQADTTMKAAKTAADPQAEPNSTIGTETDKALINNAVATPTRNRRGGLHASHAIADPSIALTPPCPTRPTGPDEQQSRRLSSPWMGDWLTAATVAASDDEAVADRTEPPTARLNSASPKDGRFHDEFVDRTITDSVRSNATEGDIRSQTLYFKSVRDLILSPAPAHGEKEILLPAHAEAIVRASIEAHEARMGSSSAPPPEFSTPICSAGPQIGLAAERGNNLM
jgi:hypothetical protein